MEKVYVQFVSEIKESILQSRYRAASLANREMLLLYYRIGTKLSEKVQESNWGSSVIQNIATDLQKELPGLRGFSFSSLKNMRQFAEEYAFLKLSHLSEIDFNTLTSELLISQSATVQKQIEIGQLLPVQFQSIGIILCKEKTDKVVEFAFRDYNKAMGVATYKTSRQLPIQYKGILPDLNELKELL